MNQNIFPSDPPTPAYTKKNEFYVEHRSPLATQLRTVRLANEHNPARRDRAPTNYPLVTYMPSLPCTAAPRPSAGSRPQDIATSPRPPCAYPPPPPRPPSPAKHTPTSNHRKSTGSPYRLLYNPSYLSRQDANNNQRGRSTDRLSDRLTNRSAVAPSHWTTE